MIDIPLTYNQRKLCEALAKGHHPEMHTPEFCNGFLVALLTLREQLCGIGLAFNEQAAFEFDKYTKIDEWRKQADK